MTQFPGGPGRLGDRTVARIGYGAMQLEDAVASNTARRDAAVALLRRARELGVDHIDTAHFYGAANEVIAAALAPYPDDLALVGKVGAVREPGGALVAAQRPEQLREQVELNLAGLKTDRLAVVNLRRVDFGPGIVGEGDQLVDLDHQLAELVAMRDAGMIGAIGLSHVDTARLQQALPAGVVCVQNLHNLLERPFADVLALCRTHGIAWVPFFPLGSGRPGRARVTDAPEVREVAHRHGVSAAQVALAWELADYDETLLIPGTADITHLEDNLAAGGVELTADDLTLLDAVAPAAGQ